MKKLTAAILLISLLTGCILCFAAEKKEIKVFADMTEIPYGSKDKNVILKGNVKISHSTIIVLSQYVEYNKESNTANSPGRITLNTPEANVTADKGSGNFKAGFCTAQNNVSAVIRRGFVDKIKNPDTKADAAKEITTDIMVNADYAEYYYKDKILKAKGNVVIREKDRIIQSDIVTYDIREELFTLHGNVKGTDEDGQTFESPGKVLVSIKDGNEYVRAPNAGISFFVEEE